MGIAKMGGGGGGGGQAGKEEFPQSSGKNWWFLLLLILMMFHYKSMVSSQKLHDPFHFDSWTNFKTTTLSLLFFWKLLIF